MYEEIAGFILGALAGLVPGLHINTVAQVAGDRVNILTAAGAYAVFSIFQAMFFLSASSNDVGALPIVARAVRASGNLSTYLHHTLGVLTALAFGGVLYNTGMIDAADEFLRPFFPYILLFSVAVLLAKSKAKRTYAALFLCSGVVGAVALARVENALFIVFSGMFAVPSILWNAKNESPEENSEPIKGESVGAAMFGVLLGFLGALLPGISSPSVLATVVLPAGLSPQAYVSMFSSTSTAQYIYAYRAHEEIGTSRVGWLKGQGKNNIETMFLGALVAAGMGFAILRIAPPFLERLRWFALAAIVLGAASSGFIGMLTLIISSLIGKAAFNAEVEKTSLLGAIILPTLLFYFIPMLQL